MQKEIPQFNESQFKRNFDQFQVNQQSSSGYQTVSFKNNLSSERASGMPGSQAVSSEDHQNTNMAHQQTTQWSDAQFSVREGTFATKYGMQSQKIPQLSITPVPDKTERIHDRLFETDKAIHFQSKIPQEMEQSPHMRISEETPAQRLNQQYKVTEVIQEHSLEISNMSNSKNGSSILVPARPNINHAFSGEGLNNTHDYRNADRLGYSTSIRNGRLVSTTNNFEDESQHQVLSDGSRVAGARVTTEPMEQKDDLASVPIVEEEYLKVLHVDSNSGSNEHQHIMVQPLKEVLFHHPRPPVPGVPSSLLSNLTTNNHSKKSFLLDQRKVDQSKSPGLESPHVPSYGFQYVNSERGMYQSSSMMPFSNINSKSGTNQNSKPGVSLSSRNVNSRAATQQNSQGDQKLQQSNRTNDLTNNGKSEPMCSDMETQRNTSVSNQNKPYETYHKSHELIQTQQLVQNGTSFGGGNDRSQQVLPQRPGPYFQLEEGERRLTRSTEPQARDESSLNSRKNLFQANISTSLSNNIQKQSNSELIMNQIKVGRARSSEAVSSYHQSISRSPQIQPPSRLFNNLASVQELGKQEFVPGMITQPEIIHAEDLCSSQDFPVLSSGNQMLASLGKFQASMAGGIQNLTEDAYDYKRRANHPGHRNFFVHSSLTFNGSNMAEKLRQNDNEIEIWDGENQTDTRQVQIEDKKMIVGHRPKFTKQTPHSQNHTRTNSYNQKMNMLINSMNSQALKNQVSSNQEGSTSQGLTQSQSQSKHVLPVETQILSQGHSTFDEHKRGAREVLVETQFQTGDQTLFEVLNPQMYVQSQDGCLDIEYDTQLQSKHVLNLLDQKTITNGNTFTNSVLPIRQSVDSILMPTEKNTQPRRSLEDESQEVVTTALEPQQIFDLPEALLKVQVLTQQNQDLQQALTEQQDAEEQLRQMVALKENDKILLQEKNLKLETQILDLIEEKRQLRCQLDSRKLMIIDQDQENVQPNLQQQLSLQDQQLKAVQEVLNDRNKQLEQAINHIQLEQGKQYEIDNLRQSLNLKDQELNNMKYVKSEKEQWLEAQCAHVAKLSEQVENAWKIIGQNSMHIQNEDSPQNHMIGAEQLNHIQNFQANGSFGDCVEEQIAHSEAETSPEPISQRQNEMLLVDEHHQDFRKIYSPPRVINNISTSPVAKEVNKLQGLFSNLTEHLASIVGSKRQDQSNNSQLSNDLQDLTRQLKEVIKPNTQPVASVGTDPVIKERLLTQEKVNSDLQRENEKLRNKLCQVKEQLVGVDIKLQMLKEQGKSENHDESMLRSQLLEARIDGQKALLGQKQIKLDLAEKYDKQLKEMRACLGFCFGVIGLKKDQVPHFLSHKLDQRLGELAVNDQMYCALKVFEKSVKSLKDDLKQKNGLDKEFENLEKLNQELSGALDQERVLKRNLLDQLQEAKGSIRVFCRIRPVLRHEVERDMRALPLQIIQPNKLNVDNKNFNFDRIFHQYSNQQDVFDEVQPLVHHAMNGSNVCIMSYGQTGTGKTFTMVGDDNDPGLYFKTVNEIFKNTGEKQITCSVVEIYNERIRDLLSKEQSEVKLMEESGQIFAHQTRRKISSKNQLLKALRDAFFNRTVGVTQFNEYSSRSHFILSIQIKQWHGNHFTNGQLSLVDLAGSERILKTDAQGIRIREAQNINQSLATLAKVFLHLKSNKTHVPYRDSKLTHYLKDSIGGQDSKTIVIVQLSPLEKDRGQSMSTLSFAQQASQIEKKLSARSMERTGRVTQNKSNQKLDRKKRLARSVTSLGSKGYNSRKPSLARNSSVQNKKGGKKPRSMSGSFKRTKKVIANEKPLAQSLLLPKRPLKNSKTRTSEQPTHRPVAQRHSRLKSKTTEKREIKSPYGGVRSVKSILSKSSNKVSGTTSPIPRRVDYAVQMNDIFQGTTTNSKEDSMSQEKDHYSQRVRRNMLDYPVTTQHVSTSRPSQDYQDRQSQPVPSAIVRARRGRDLAAVDSTVIFSTNEAPNFSLGSVSQNLSSYNKHHHDQSTTQYSFENKRQTQPSRENNDSFRIMNQDATRKSQTRRVSVKQLEDLQNNHGYISDAINYSTNTMSQFAPQSQLVASQGCNQNNNAKKTMLLDELQSVNEKLAEIDKKINRHEQLMESKKR